MNAEPLFPTDLPEREWAEFQAEGFAAPATGVIYRGTNPPTCGMPLGVIDTGCLDLEPTGLLGYSTIFNSLHPRRGPLNLPCLGVNVKAVHEGMLSGKDPQTWLLTTLDLAGPELMVFHDHYAHHDHWGVKVCSEIHYWGHYPIADLEFVSDAPIGVGLRVWSPFLPGDVAASNTPGAVFEVRLRNRTTEPQEGTLAFSFPGPSEEEAGTTSFRRQSIREQHLNGVVVEAQQAGYALAAIGEPEVRVGGELGTDTHKWAALAWDLPYARSSAGATVAVDFSVSANEERIIRFVLAWYAPEWMGGGTMASGGNAYTHMYAARYEGATEVARFLADRHASLLQRIIAWQEVLYSDGEIPGWLADGLINILHLITETSVWGQAKPPIGDWCGPEDGLFSMNESPRACPQMDCTPCGFYGNWPVVYFFPDAALANLRAYQAYQYPDGRTSWLFGGGASVGIPPYEIARPVPDRPSEPQTTLNGPCYVDMVDRMWLRTGDDSLLTEFYESVKRSTRFTMGLVPEAGDAGLVSIPGGNTEWYEYTADYVGVVPHIGGVHLAQLRMAQRMAEAVGDSEFAEQCADWLQRGSRAMEELAWAGTHYMLFHDPDTGAQQPDIVMSHQLDGQWMTLLHGLQEVFDTERAGVTLDTIARVCPQPSRFGAPVVFCRADGRPLGADDWSPGFWGAHGTHPPGAFMLAMLYLYGGQREQGLEFVKQVLAELARRGWQWDSPCVIDAARAPRVGMDYYQNLLLWAVPAGLQGTDLAGPCQPGGLVDRVMQAAGGAQARASARRSHCAL